MRNLRRPRRSIITRARRRISNDVDQVNMRQHVSATANAREPELIQDGPLVRIDYDDSAAGGRRRRRLLLPPRQRRSGGVHRRLAAALAQRRFDLSAPLLVRFPFVCDDLAARDAADGDDHVGLCVGSRGSARGFRGFIDCMTSLYAHIVSLLFMYFRLVKRPPQVRGGGSSSGSRVRRRSSEHATSLDVSRAFYFCPVLSSCKVLSSVQGVRCGVAPLASSHTRTHIKALRVW